MRWVPRRAHTRLGKGGRIIPVKECFVPNFREKTDKSVAYRSSCPYCGAQIISVKMPNGGWGHFEGGKGLARIKHACFNRGENLSNKREDDMADLFDKVKET